MGLEFSPNYSGFSSNMTLKWKEQSEVLTLFEIRFEDKNTSRHFLTYWKRRKSTSAAKGMQVVTKNENIIVMGAPPGNIKDAT